MKRYIFILEEIGHPENKITRTIEGFDFNTVKWHCMFSFPGYKIIDIEEQDI